MSLKKDNLQHLICAAADEIGVTRKKLWKAERVADRLRMELAAADEVVATHNSSLSKAEAIWEVLSPLQEGVLAAKDPSSVTRAWSSVGERTRLRDWAEKVMQSALEGAKETYRCGAVRACLGCVDCVSPAKEP